MEALSKKTPVKSKIEVITQAKFSKITQEFEDSMLRVWKNSAIIVPRMLLDFRVHFQEIYASIPGKILVFTPFWRGRTFSDSILLHEFLHWAIYPIDLFKSLHDLFMARRLLADELGYKPKIRQTDLYGKVEEWKDFEYSVREFGFCQNVLGDYLINIHIHDYHPTLFDELWQFLYHDGTFYEEQKQLKRDTSFLLYLSVYPEILTELTPVTLIDPQTEKDRDSIVKIIEEMRRGRMSKAFAIKELVKIFHDYLKKDEKNKGKGKGQGGEPKCPQCGHDEFEVVGFEDPETGKWVDV